MNKDAYKNDRYCFYILLSSQETELSSARVEELLSKVLKGIEKTNYILKEIWENIFGDESKLV